MVNHFAPTLYTRTHPMTPWPRFLAVILFTIALLGAGEDNNMRFRQLGDIAAQVIVATSVAQVPPGEISASAAAVSVCEDWHGHILRDDIQPGPKAVWRSVRAEDGFDQIICTWQVGAITYRTRQTRRTLILERMEPTVEFALQQDEGILDLANALAAATCRDGTAIFTRMRRIGSEGVACLPAVYPSQNVQATTPQEAVMAIGLQGRLLLVMEKTMLDSAGIRLGIGDLDNERAWSRVR